MRVLRFRVSGVVFGRCWDLGLGFRVVHVILRRGSD